MPEIRHVASGDTPEQVLAGAVGRLTADLADLRSTVLARTAAATAVGARAYRSSALSVVNATVTVIGLDAESFDTQTLHDTATNNSRITLARVGKWLVVGQVEYAVNAVGLRQARVHLNGTYTGYSSVLAGSNGTVVQATAVVAAAATTDYVELAAYQESGGALSLTTGPAATWLAATFLGA